MKTISTFKWISLALCSLFLVANANQSYSDLVVRGEREAERPHSSGAEAGAHRYSDSALEHHNMTGQHYGEVTHPEARAYERGEENSAANSAGGSVYVVPEDPNVQYNPNGTDNWGQ